MRNIVVGQIGERPLAIHKADSKGEKVKTIKLQHKLLNFSSNPRQGEICVLEGSDKILMNYYSYKYKKPVDSIELGADTLDFDLNKNKSSCIVLRDGACSIYSYNFDEDYFVNEFDYPQ